MPDVIDWDIEKEEFGDVLFDELEIFVAAKMRDVVDAAGNEVVDGNDFVAACQKVITKVRAEKTGAAGDDRSWFTGFGVLWFGHMSQIVL